MVCQLKTFDPINGWYLWTGATWVGEHSSIHFCFGSIWVNYAGMI